MSMFAIAQSSDDLSRLSADLMMLGRHGSRRDSQRRETLLGVWVERHRPVFPRPSHGTLQRLLDDRSLPLVFSLERGGAWALCETASASVTRATVVNTLSAIAAADDTTNRGRFLPVFGPDVTPDEVARECTRLSKRYPGRILPPVRQSAGGALLFEDVRWGCRPQLDLVEIPYLA